MLLFSAETKSLFVAVLCLTWRPLRAAYNVFFFFYLGVWCVSCFVVTRMHSSVRQTQYPSQVQRLGVNIHTTRVRWSAITTQKATSLVIYEDPYENHFGDEAFLVKHCIILHFTQVLCSVWSIREDNLWIKAIAFHSFTLAVCPLPTHAQNTKTTWALSESQVTVITQSA